MFRRLSSRSKVPESDRLDFQEGGADVDSCAQYLLTIVQLRTLK
jgi:hypothetical protein